MPVLVDGVELIGRSGHRRETDLVKSQVLFQMAENLDYVGHTRGQRDARRNRPRAMILDQRPHSGLDDVVAARAVGENAQLVVHFLGPIHADGHADAVLREKLDDGWA